MSKRVNIFSNLINYRVYTILVFTARRLYIARTILWQDSHKIVCPPVRLSDVCLSVCRSVSLSYAGILSKRLNISSNYATAELLVFLVFSVPNTMLHGNILTGMNKKLSYRTETARFMSLNISLSNSRSLTVIRNDTLE